MRKSSERTKFRRFFLHKTDAFSDESKLGSWRFRWMGHLHEDFQKQFQNDIGNPLHEERLAVFQNMFACFQSHTEEYQQQGDASFPAVVLFFTALSLTRGGERREEGLSWTGGWGRDGIWRRELHVKAWGKLSLSFSLSLSLSLSLSHTHTALVSVCVCVWMWCLQAAGEWRGFCRGRLCGRNVCNYTTTQTEEKWQCRLNSYSTERRWELHVSFHCIFAINSIV